MKNLLYILVASLLIMQSCIIEAPVGRDGLDGNAFFSMNYGEKEPYFVDAGGVIPDNFYWDSYYKTYSGYYTVYYEYEYFTNMGRIIEPWEIEVEVFNIQGEPADHNYDGQDGNDVYFDLILFPDGAYDFTHNIAYNKSEHTLSSVSERTQIGYKEEIKNGVRVVTTYYKLPNKK